jgi:Helix-turn-helix domain
MGKGEEAFWSALPEKASHHPVRELLLEALRWIDEPLSAKQVTDVLDGERSMWEAAHHFRILEDLGVVELLPSEERWDEKDEPYVLEYRLVGPERG